MAHYTTQLRSYLETLAGYKEEQDFDKVDTIIQATREKIFTKPYVIWNEEYKPVIESKILYHYYMREIGMETVGLWKYHMNRVMNEIMPYYSKLYESAELKYNPLFDTDYTREGNREGTEDSTRESSTNGTEDSTATSTGIITDKGKTADTGTSNRTTNTSSDSKDRFSDTPQNGLSQVENNQYLTTYRNITDTGNTTEQGSTTANGTSENVRSMDTKDENHGTTNTSGTETGDIDTTEKWVEHIAGKMGSGSYANLVKEYRDTLINIDALVINCFEDCFMQLV